MVSTWEQAFELRNMGRELEWELPALHFTGVGWEASYHSKATKARERMPRAAHGDTERSIEGASGSLASRVKTSAVLVGSANAQLVMSPLVALKAAALKA